jgi:hypothetical protein
MSKRLQYRVSFVGTQKTVNKCKVLAAAYGLEGEAWEFEWGEEFEWGDGGCASFRFSTLEFAEWFCASCRLMGVQSANLVPGASIG